MCSLLYSIENFLKIWSLEWKRYIKNGLQLADGLISITFFVSFKN